jgi:hypothetical protein
MVSEINFTLEYGRRRGILILDKALSLWHDFFERPTNFLRIRPVKIPPSKRFEAHRPSIAKKLRLTV